MNAFVLMLPLFLIRFGLLGRLNPAALRRAAHFAPQEGGEKAAGLFYQLSNLVLILFPLCLRVHTGQPWFYPGLTVYLLGVVLLVLSTAAFAKPDGTGLNTAGLYRFSRNPMYVGYFVYFLGCAALTRAPVMLLALLVFQLSAHWIIRSEERWCVQRFGAAYTAYMGRVRRYL